MRAFLGRLSTGHARVLRPADDLAAEERRLRLVLCRSHLRRDARGLVTGDRQSQRAQDATKFTVRTHIPDSPFSGQEIKALASGQGASQST